MVDALIIDEEFIIPNGSDVAVYEAERVGKAGKPFMLIESVVLAHHIQFIGWASSEKCREEIILAECGLVLSELFKVVLVRTAGASPGRWTRRRVGSRAGRAPAWLCSTRY